MDGPDNRQSKSLVHFVADISDLDIDLGVKGKSGIFASMQSRAGLKNIMPQLEIYPEAEMPDHLRWQSLSFFRTHWPDGFMGNNLYRDWIAPQEYHLVSIMMTQGKLLLSYVGVMWKPLKHEGQTYKMYGLSGMFTFPSARMQGFGAQVVKTAKEYIEQTDGDIVVFTSLQERFYEKFGFLAMPSVKLLIGDKLALRVYDEATFMLFLSEKGRQGRESFERTPIYFGAGVW